MTSTAARAQNSKPLEIGARVGFAVNGLLHILIGGIALGVAFGGGGSADQSGALGQLASNPVGAVVLWVIVVGLAALGAFSILTAIVEKGETKDRVKDAAKGVAYLAVAATALRFALGGSSDSSQQTESLSATLLETPGGVVLLVVLGLAVIGVGVYFVVKGARQKFRDDISTPSGTVGKATVVTGTVGYVAKGIAIAVVGILFVVAAFTADASKASGLDGALKSLVELPFGVAVLTVVALGLIAFGVYSFLRARLARL
jgi:hypothetical protein